MWYPLCLWQSPPVSLLPLTWLYIPLIVTSFPTSSISDHLPRFLRENGSVIGCTRPDGVVGFSYPHCAGKFPTIHSRFCTYIPHITTSLPAWCGNSQTRLLRGDVRIWNLGQQFKSCSMSYQLSPIPRLSNIDSALGSVVLSKNWHTTLAHVALPRRFSWRLTMPCRCGLLFSILSTPILAVFRSFSTGFSLIASSFC